MPGIDFNNKFPEHNILLRTQVHTLRVLLTIYIFDKVNNKHPYIHNDNKNGFSHNFVDLMQFYVYVACMQWLNNTMWVSG